jgi:hypothetical protein
MLLVRFVACMWATGSMARVPRIIGTQYVGAVAVAMMRTSMGKPGAPKCGAAEK